MRVAPRRLTYNVAGVTDSSTAIDVPESSLPSPRSRSPRRTSPTMFLDDHVLTVPFRSIVYFCCGLPLFAFITCVFLSITLHSATSTRTHCQVNSDTKDSVLSRLPTSSRQYRPRSAPNHPRSTYGAWPLLYTACRGSSWAWHTAIITGLPFDEQC